MTDFKMKTLVLTSITLLLIISINSNVGGNSFKINDLYYIYSSPNLKQEPITIYTYGGRRYDYAYSAIETSDGGFALAGFTDSYGAGRDDMWLVKTTATGQIEWHQTYGRTATDCAYSIIEMSNGGYALVSNTASYGARGECDIWFVKTTLKDNTNYIVPKPSKTSDFYVIIILGSFLAVTVSFLAQIVYNKRKKR